jgi:uncharacterized membrane protein YqhA
MKKIIEKSKYVVILPVIIFLISSILSAFYGSYLFVKLLYSCISSNMYISTKSITAEILSIIDIFLLVVIQYIFCIGLYELFIGDLETPQWLKISTIDHLKAALASFISLFLSILFVQLAVKSENVMEILYSGIGIASVIGVLVFYYKVKSSSH